MADFMFGMRRMLGLTTPAEEADFATRQQVVEQEAMRNAQVQPGTALRERQELLDSSMEELRRQQSVVPASASPAPAPAAPSYEAPRYGESAAPAMDALKGYGVRSVVNPALPKPRKEEEQIQIRVNPSGIRG